MADLDEVFSRTEKIRGMADLLATFAEKVKEEIPELRSGTLTTCLFMIEDLAEEIEGILKAES